MTRSAIVNNTTYVVENIIVADPVDPSPFEGTIMVGLQEPVYEQQTVTTTVNHPAGTTFKINSDSSVTLTLPDGQQEELPAGTTVVSNSDGTVTTSYSSTQSVLISAGTPCDMGWIYNPSNGTFSAP